MNFDKNSLNKFNAELEQVLKALAEKHGIEVKVAGGKFTELTFTPRVEFSKTDSSGNTKHASEFIQWGKLDNMKPEWLNMSFVYSGKSYKIVGYDSRKHKKPVMLLCDDGKTYNCSSDFVIPNMK